MSQAAIDLGLVPPPDNDHSLEAFHLRATTLLLSIQSAHGMPEAAALFERIAALARAVERAKRPPATSRRSAAKPPKKKKGAHDPSGDANLLALWRNTPYSSKHEFARELIKRKLVRMVDAKSLVRHLNRLLKKSPYQDK
jgi:hypothetical protein